MPAAMPDRIAIDANGFGWRVWNDEEAWSMVPTNPDNSAIPEPVQWFVRADSEGPTIQGPKGPVPLVDVLAMALRAARADMAMHPKDYPEQTRQIVGHAYGLWKGWAEGDGPPKLEGYR